MSDLEVIRQTNRDNVDDCFRDMLEKWLRTSLRPTQSNLLTVLREKTIGFNQLAEELESKSLKRDRVINQLRMASTKFMTRTSAAPSLVNVMSVIKIGALILLAFLFLTTLNLEGIYHNLISPKNCFATGSGLEVAVVGDRANAVVHLVNQRGAAYTKQVNVITCELIHELTSKILDCEIIWKARYTIMTTNYGQYEVSYQPTCQGRHQLHIKVEGEHIKGSPFTVTVKLPVQKLGTPIKTISGLKQPWGVAVNQRAEILVAERYGHCISVFSSTGEKLQSFGSKGFGRGQFNGPRGVTVDDDGNILVADNHRIQKFTSKFQFITSVGSYGSNNLQFDHPVSVAVSPTTKVIAISDCLNHRVQILNPDLIFNSSIGSKGSGNGELSCPHDVAFDSAGNMYVVDASNNRIQVFTPEGKYMHQFEKTGKDDGKLDYPISIHIDSDNIIHVTEGGNHCVSLFTLEGEFLTSFGSEGDGPGQFNRPQGITMEKQGMIHVTDGDNNHIQTFPN